MSEKPRFTVKLSPLKQAAKSCKEDMQPKKYFELFYDEEVMDFITIMFNLYEMQDEGEVSFFTKFKEIKCWLVYQP